MLGFPLLRQILHHHLPKFSVSGDHFTSAFAFPFQKGLNARVRTYAFLDNCIIIDSEIDGNILENIGKTEISRPFEMVGHNLILQDNLRFSFSTIFQARFTTVAF